MKKGAQFNLSNKVEITGHCPFKASIYYEGLWIKSPLGRSLQKITETVSLC
jgi:hypothetical protein